jgi:biopolymer transport protein TolQ
MVVIMFNVYVVLAKAPFLTSYSQSDLFGKLIFWSLFLLSGISWIILINKIYTTKSLKKYCSQFENSLQSKTDHFFNINTESMPKSPYVNIFNILKQKTLEILNKNRFFKDSEDKKQVYLSRSDIELIESHLYTTISSQIKSLEKNLFVLSTIVTLAPFLGLLGTVWGILITFSELQSHSLASGSSAVLSGLSMALSTTVVGLVVAIPALVADKYLKSALKDFSKDMEYFSHNLLGIVEIQYRRADIG